MMKVTLAFTLVLALTYSVSTETINCYSCTKYSISRSRLNNFLAQGEIPASPSDLCNNPIELSPTVEVDNTENSCAEAVLKSTAGSKAIIRTALLSGTCPELADALLEGCDGVGSDCSVDCSECTSNRCNVDLPHTPSIPPSETLLISI